MWKRKRKYEKKDWYYWSFIKKYGGRRYKTTSNHTHHARPKDRTLALILCAFLGIFGAHKFYEGKIGMGLLYLFTAGLFLIGVIVDFVALLSKPPLYNDY